MGEVKKSVQTAYSDWLTQRMAVEDQIEALRQSVENAKLAVFAEYCPVRAGDVVRVERRWFRLAQPSHLVMHFASGGMPLFEWKADPVNPDGTVREDMIERGAVKVTFSPVKNPKTGRYEYEVVRRPRPDEPIEKVG